MADPTGPWWWKFTDNAICWQNTAGTIAVVNHNDPVLRIDGIGSAAGNNLLVLYGTPRWDATAGKVYLDGSSAFSININLSTTDKVTACLSWDRTSDATVVWPLCFELNREGSFNIRAPLSAGGSDYTAWVRGTSGKNYTRTGYAAPRTDVVTLQGDIAGQWVDIRVNGNTDGGSTEAVGTGNFGTGILAVGNYGNNSRYMTGHLTFASVDPSILTGTTLTDLEAYAADPEAGSGGTIAAGAANSAGSTVVTGAGTAVVGFTGVASGTSTATGVGAAIASGAAQASGASVATGHGGAVAAGAAPAEGTSSATGVGAAIAAGAADAHGQTTVTGITESTPSERYAFPGESAGGWIEQERAGGWVEGSENGGYVEGFRP